MSLNIPYILETQRPKRHFKNVDEAIVYYRRLEEEFGRNGANDAETPCFKCSGALEPERCDLCQDTQSIDRPTFEAHVRHESEKFMKVWLDWSFSVRAYRALVGHLSEDSLNSLRKYGVLVDKIPEYDTLGLGDKNVCRLPDVIPSPVRSCCRLTPRNAQAQ